MDTVIFACVHNAGRSQMAAAFFNQLADSGTARAVSAGTHPGERVHPIVVEAMKEVGLDLAKSTAEAHRGIGARRHAADHDGLRRRVSVRPRSRSR